MSILENVVSGIDFTDTRVQILFIVMVLPISLVVSAIFFIFKLFIPKSKMQDIQTIDKAIRRLKKLMFFDKAVLCVNADILIIMAILHFTKTIDIFEKPLVWIAAILTAIMNEESNCIEYKKQHSACNNGLV